MPLPSEKLVFAHSVEALFGRGLEQKMTLRCAQRLKDAGIDITRKLLPAYPLEAWKKALQIACEEIFPGDSREDALRKLGEQLFASYEQTLLGKAVVPAIRLLGPKRSLERATHNFRTANNYTEARLTQQGPSRYELWMSDAADHPTYFQGILAAGLRLAGARSLKVELASQDGTAFAYRLSWDDAAQP